MEPLSILRIRFAGIPVLAQSASDVQSNGRYTAAHLAGVVQKHVVVGDSISCKSVPEFSTFWLA